MGGTRDTMKHAAIYSAAAAAGRMISFFMLPFYAHLLAGRGYAIIGMLDMSVALLTTLMGYGTTSTIVRLFHDEQDPARKNIVVTTGVTLSTAVSAVLCIPVALLARPLAGLLLEDPALAKFLLMTLVGFVFEMAGQSAGAWLMIHRRSVRYTSINLFKLLLGLALNIYLIVVKKMGLDGYFLSSMFTSMAANSLFLLIVARECSWKVDRLAGKAIADYLLPLIPGNLVGYAARQVERIMVRFQIDLVSVGVLEMGYKFPILIAQLITTPFMQSWNTRRFEIADQPGAAAEMGRMFTWFLFLLLYAGLVMAVLIHPVLVILTPPEFHLAYRIARVEIATLILQGLYYHVAFGLFYAKHTGVITRIRSVMALIKIGLSWFFIQTWGVYGAAFSAAVIALASLIVTHYVSQKRYVLGYEKAKVAILSALAVLTFVLLSRWNAVDSVAGRWLVETGLPASLEPLRGTFLASFKDGKVLTLIAEREAPLAEMLLKGPLVLLFGLLLPMVRDQWRPSSVAAMLRRRR